MFGSYEFGTSIHLDSVHIETYKERGLNMYCRKPDNIKKVLSSTSDICINPVEPVIQPQEITHYLLVDFLTPVHVSPQSSLSGFVTFPVEIGVYAVLGEKVGYIDGFTITDPKYTLYGTPERGVICKWWQSKVYSTIPKVDPLREGAMKIQILNNSTNWVKLARIVVDAYYMKIYFSDFVCMNAVIKVDNSATRTSFVEEPIKEGMEKAIELFKLRKIPIVEKNEFVMEWVP